MNIIKINAQIFKYYEHFLLFINFGKYLFKKKRIYRGSFRWRYSNSVCILLIILIINNKVPLKCRGP